MARHTIVISACLLLNALSSGKTDGVGAHNTAQIEDSPTLDAKPYGVGENLQSAKERSTPREKRFYNYFDYSFDYNQRPEYSGNYGVQDPLELILKKLQEITNNAKRTYLPPPPQIPRPAYIPILYVPRNECPCAINKDQTTNRPVPNAPITPNKTNSSTNTETPNKDSMPEFTTRMDLEETRDTRDNGDEDYGDELDGARPITLIKPVKSNKPSPPLEHGSSQAGLEPPKQPQLAQEAPPAVEAEKDSVNPTVCESAAVFCCHKPEVTMECFLSQGCRNPLELGEPCHPQVLLKIINKLQYLYNSKIVERRR